MQKGQEALMPRTDHDQQAYQLAVKIGLMPADVEDALRDARMAEQRLPLDSEIEADAEITESDKERDRTWWMYNAPNEFKRLLTAVERE